MGLQNNADEMEVMDADSQKLAAMLNALPRVEAPANFEFRVKGGIAKGNPSRSGILPFLKAAAPFALILVILSLGFFFYQRPIATETASVPSTPVVVPAVPPAQVETAAAPSATESVPSREIQTAQIERAATQPDRPSPTRRTAAANPSIRPQGGSVDRILHPGNVIMPPGFESANPQNRNANTAGTATTSTPVREVLGMYGIDGDFAQGGWKVRSVKENGVGSRAKIEAGDVIESVDGQPIKNDAKLKDGAKTFTVRRGGKLITLSSGN